MAGSTEQSVALTSALGALALACARVQTGDDAAAHEIVRAATADLPPEAEVAARACLDEVLALRDRATRAHAAREALLAAVAHDLRNPLNTLAMSAGLLREDIERDDVDAERDLGLVHRMDRGIERMRRIVEDVLDASRIEARKVDLVRRPEAAAQIAKEAIAAAAPGAEHGVTSVVDSGLDVEARVFVDRARAVQAISRVLGFIQRSSAEGSQVQVSVVRDGASVTFLVTAPVAARAAARSENVGGLGLLIARGIAELHGGSLDVHIDHRATVTLKLPAAT